MFIDRRRLLSMAAAAGSGLFAGAAPTRADAQGSDQWFPITGDDGKPVANLRQPVELISEVEALPGTIRVGSKQADAAIIEFYDYNCPFCRKAARDVKDLLAADRGLRLGLVSNPILSPQSKDAAKVELAVLKLRGSKVAYEFHERLFRVPGRIDGEKAIGVATAIGLERGELVRATSHAEVLAAIEDQLRLAASMGLAATPSFLIGGAGVLGYPGPKALARMIGSERKCGAVTC